MKNNDLEKRFGMKLKDAYMKENVGTLMSRDEFHSLIKKAENGKRKRRILTGAAAASVALCLIFGGFVAGMSMRESASAGRDDDTKTVQQGNGVVIGSGVSENDQNVGVSTKIYTKIEDIPEDIRKEIHFLDNDEFELEKVNVTVADDDFKAVVIYVTEDDKKIEISQSVVDNDMTTVIDEIDKEWTYKYTKVYEKIGKDGKWYWFKNENTFYHIRMTDSKIKIETIIDGLVS